MAANAGIQNVTSLSGFELFIASATLLSRQSSSLTQSDAAREWIVLCRIPCSRELNSLRWQENSLLGRLGNS
jgi:hypothetical protein